MAPLRSESEPQSSRGIEEEISTSRGNETTRRELGSMSDGCFEEEIRTLRKNAG